MTRTQTPAVALAERLCRPQRIGVFGHRGVGKTTLLTMLYREAAGGRLPDLRLAAADARTADYLSDKVLQLEAGRALPGTLGETELRFHLYHAGARLDLLFKDYQGEHVALGRQEPIRDFLRDCDAVWLCLDLDMVGSEAVLRAEQEVEQVVEDYLATEAEGVPPRPMALVLTKADLIWAGGEVPPAGRDALIERRFAMTRHTLALHCPQHALFAVSSLGAPLPAIEEGAAPPPFTPRPAGLGGPLAWLAQTLQAQAQARLERLWQIAPAQSALLERSVASFARQYPDNPATAIFRRRLRELRRRRLGRRALVTAVTVAALLLGLRGYDAYGEQQAVRFAAAHEDDPIAVRRQWESFQVWHPTRHLFRSGAADAERTRVQELDARVRARDYADRLADLRRRAADPDADPEGVWHLLQAFHADYPDHDVDSDWQQFRQALKERRDAERERRARAALEDLDRRERKEDLGALIEQAGRLLLEHAGTPQESEIRRRHAAYLARLDEHDLEAARAYSAAHPLNFHTRREHYQRYLDRHPDGPLAHEAVEAIKAIDADWDRHDFRAVRDHFQGHPGDVQQLQVLCRSYLAAHPQGRFRDSATELLRWTERVTAPGEYRVTLRCGGFDPALSFWASRDTSLSVEIEVGGVIYGPSNIVAHRFDPDWNYEFPRRVRWKMGDRVIIRVTDHAYWRKRAVCSFASDEEDPLAMRMLSGETRSGKNSITFESDFAMPVLPAIE
jgi:hypothetical protein